jgi:hypothetical protein
LKIPVRKRGKGKHEHNPRDGEVSGVLNRPRWDACGKGTGPRRQGRRGRGLVT